MYLELPFEIGKKVSVKAVAGLNGADCTLVGYQIEFGTHLDNDEINCIVERKERQFIIPSYLVSEVEEQNNKQNEV